MKNILIVSLVCGVAFSALAQDQMQPGVGGNYRPPVYEVQTRSGTVNLLGKDHLRSRQSVTRAQPVSNVTPALSIINERYIPQSLQTQVQAQAQVSAPPQETGMQSLPVPEAQTPSGIEPAAAPTRTQSPMILEPQPITEMPLDVTMTQPGDAGVIYRDNPAASSVAPPAPSGMTQGWRARQGEEFTAVVSRWAERLETKPTNIPQGNFVLSQDFSFFGSYDRAVEKLLEMRAQAPVTAPQPSQVVQPAPTPTSTPAPVASTADFPQVDQVPPVQLTTPGARWFAMNGAPLNEVLKSWADQAGVVVVWQASPSLAVKSTVSQTSSFEDAVAQLLGQYDQDLTRPRGQLYRNPVDGKRVLVIREEKLGTPPQS